MGQIMNLPANNIVAISPTAEGNFSAEVMVIQDNLYQLKHKGQTILANKAFSCLVQPQVQDTVLYSFDQYQQAFIVAILHRNEDSQLTVQLPANATIACDQNLTLRSGQHTSIISEQITQLSQQSVMKTDKAVMDFNNAIIKGGKLHSQIRHIHTISDLVSTMAKQAIQKFNSYIRKTDQADQVHAGQMGRKVDGLYSMNSKHTILVSQKDTKIDGEHIHMG